VFDVGLIIWGQFGIKFRFKITSRGHVELKILAPVKDIINNLWGLMYYRTVEMGIQIKNNWLIICQT